MKNERLERVHGRLCELYGDPLHGNAKSIIFQAAENVRRAEEMLFAGFPRMARQSAYDAADKLEVAGVGTDAAADLRRIAQEDLNKLA